MSEEDSNTEQEFPEVPPFPYDNELEMLRKMSEGASSACSPRSTRRMRNHAKSKF